jgi:hypothetical protein
MAPHGYRHDPVNIYCMGLILAPGAIGAQGFYCRTAFSAIRQAVGNAQANRGGQAGARLLRPGKKLKTNILQ